MQTNHGASVHRQPFSAHWRHPVLSPAYQWASLSYELCLMRRFSPCLSHCDARQLANTLSGQWVTSYDKYNFSKRKKSVNCLRSILEMALFCSLPSLMVLWSDTWVDLYLWDLCPWRPNSSCFMWWSAVLCNVHKKNKKHYLTHDRVDFAVATRKLHICFTSQGKAAILFL